MKRLLAPTAIVLLLTLSLFSFLTLVAPPLVSAAPACPADTFDYPDAATCSNLCKTTCYADPANGEKLCCADTPTGTCPSGTDTFSDPVQCRNSCSLDCVSSSGLETDVKNCCPTPGAGVCPAFTNAQSNEASCASLCAPFNRECKNDSDGIKRCAPTLCKAAEDDAGTDDLIGLPKKRDEIKLGFITISTKPAEFAADILELGIGAGALLAVLFIIVGGFGVATSAGDPDKLQKAKSQITAAVSGLVFLLLAGLILNIIGELILGIDFF